MSQCIRQHDWSVHLHTAILNVNPETLETDLKDHLPSSANGV